MLWCALHLSFEREWIVLRNLAQCGFQRRVKQSQLLQSNSVVGVDNEVARRLVVEQRERSVCINVKLAQKCFQAEFVHVNLIFIHIDAAVGLLYFKSTTFLAADVIHIYGHSRCPVIQIAQLHIHIAQLYIIRVESCAWHHAALRIYDMTFAQSDGIASHHPSNCIVRVIDSVGGQRVKLAINFGIMFAQRVVSHIGAVHRKCVGIYGVFAGVNNSVFHFRLTDIGV